MNNDPELLLLASMKLKLRFVMQVLNCYGYKDLRETCLEIIGMLDHVESYKKEQHG